MQTNRRGIVGWDIGGAHVKLSVLSSTGKWQRIEQHACALWKGLDQLDVLLSQLDKRLRFGAYEHAVTMTGELVDLFADRGTGVRAILKTLQRHVDAASVRIFTLPGELCSVGVAQKHCDSVASANWCATATAIARRLPDVLLIDIGSTTTDIIPVRNGRVRARGSNDAERLRHDELVYTGVVRTPIMALTDRLKFAGHSQRIAAEWFATTGDVYRLLGKLPRHGYQSTTADGAGIAERDCARRLARVLGMDLQGGSMSMWKTVAREVAELQQRQIGDAVRSVLARQPRVIKPVIVGAGCGRFIAAALARKLHLPYRSFDGLMKIPARLSNQASICAPAVAVAHLASDGYKAPFEKRDRG